MRAVHRPSDNMIDAVMTFARDTVLVPAGLAALVLIASGWLAHEAVRRWPAVLAIASAVLANAVITGWLPAWFPSGVVERALMLWLLFGLWTAFVMAHRLRRTVSAPVDLAFSLTLAWALVEPLYPQAVGTLGAVLWALGFTLVQALLWWTVGNIPSHRHDHVITAALAVITVGVAALVGMSGSVRTGQLVLAAAGGTAVVTVACLMRGDAGLGRGATGVVTFINVSALGIGYLYGSIPLAATILTAGAHLIPWALAPNPREAPTKRRVWMRVGTLLLPLGGAAMALLF